MTSTTDCTVTASSPEATKDRLPALAALWDHFARDAVLEMLRVAELAGIDVSGPIKLYAWAWDGASVGTSVGP